MLGPEFRGIARERARDLIHDGVRLGVKRFSRRGGQGMVHLDDGQAAVALPPRYRAAAVAEAPAHDDAGGASHPLEPDRIADTPRRGGASVPHADQHGVAARVQLLENFRGCLLGQVMLPALDDFLDLE